jgi:hypothetical protein
MKVLKEIWGYAPEDKYALEVPRILLQLPVISLSRSFRKTSHLRWQMFEK